MEVYFNTNYWGHPNSAEPMKPIEIKKEFTYGEITGFIPAAYVSEEGIALDFCVRIPNEKVQAFWDKWHTKMDGVLDMEDAKQIGVEDPFRMDFGIKIAVNGMELENALGCSISYTTIYDNVQAADMKLERQMLAEYGCDSEGSWCFRRQMSRWDKQPEIIEEIGVNFFTYEKPYEGEEIAIGMDSVGKTYELRHPRSGEIYQLTIDKVEQQALDCEFLEQIDEGLRNRVIRNHNLNNDKLDNRELNNLEIVYPSQYLSVAYHLTPEIAQNQFVLKSAGKGDSPRGMLEKQASAVTVIGGCDGPTSIFFAGKNGGQGRLALTDLYFEPLESCLWNPVFMEKEQEDMQLIIQM